MALLSYLGLLFLIPLFAAPNSRFARFHANQGLVLCIALVCFGVVYGILAAVFTVVFYALGIYRLLSLLLLLIWAIPIIFMVLGIVNCVQGRAKELPLIGGIKIIK
jgi:uncharacterized membrane protein